jgi:hypothetical protein
MLELAARFAPPAAQMIRQMSLQSLALDDPSTALDYVERLELGPERDQLMMTIASTYARTDPVAAVAWAQGLEPAPPGVLATVLGGLAQNDPERAIGLALELEGVDQVSTLQSVILGSVMRDARYAELIADRLLGAATRPGERDQALQTLLSAWSQRDPTAALRWMIANADSVTPFAFANLGRELGRRDPQSAAAYANQLPSEVRGEWIAAVGAGYAMSDPRGAASWIAQYRGQPGYDAAAAAIASQIAQYDAAAAAGLVATITSGSPQAQQAAASVASQWAIRNPREAAAWAVDLDGGARAQATAMVVQHWLRVDSSAARAWALSLPSGDLRDQALMAVVSDAAASTGIADPVALNALSTPAARHAALQRTIFVLGRTDPAAARRLIDEHVADPAARQQLERALESINNARNGVFGISSGFQQAFVPGGVVPPVITGAGTFPPNMVVTVPDPAIVSGPAPSGIRERR